MPEPRHFELDSAGVGLHIYAFGDTTRPTVVMLHGMRDVGLSLTPVAEYLSADYQVLLMDLRGHGRSDRPGSYAMPDYLFDLHNLLSHSASAPVALFGHSLGGQIVARFCALFPNLVRAAVIVEGLGPPARPFLSDLETSLRMEGARILATLSAAKTTRALPDTEFAAQRLLANNPRLSHAQATVLASQATQRDADGNLVWAFDPRVSAVFLGSGENASERYWPAVKCPALLVTGDHAHEYWSGAMGPGMAAGMDWDGRYAEGELEARLAQFVDHEHQAFAGSGHMVHFDEPDRLARVTHDFLRRRYE